MLEKREECPQCGEVKRWLYDAQICATCGHGDRFWNERNKERPNERGCLTECNGLRSQHKRPDVAKV